MQGGEVESTGENTPVLNSATLKTYHNLDRKPNAQQKVASNGTAKPVNIVQLA